MSDTIEQTPAQIAEEKKQQALAEAKAARVKQVSDIRARRAELEKNIGQTFTDGEKDAVIESLEKNNIRTETGWLADDRFVVNFGNPHVHKIIKVEEFLKNYQPKGTP